MAPETVEIPSGTLHLKAFLWKPPAIGAAASSWDDSPELRTRMLTTLRKMTVPVLLLHAANDYSVTPGQAMAGELARLSKPHVLKIYPAVGQSANDGHNFVYTDIAH
jgi:alpha-beta hydrolase superfamily lysophospholipase